jgi:hypothetical protein
MNKWITAKQPKQGSKAPYGLMKHAAKTASTLISEVVTALSALCEVFIAITFRLALLCGMFWLYQFVILSLLGLY